MAADAVARAEAVAPLAGWVNNAAVFRDAWLHSRRTCSTLITANLALAVTGCPVAVRHWLDAGRGGAIVNVCSHQAARPVPGALPYAMAKAAIEGLTRARRGRLRPRRHPLQRGRAGLDPDRALDALRGRGDGARLHPLGRVGRA